MVDDHVKKNKLKTNSGIIIEMFTVSVNVNYLRRGIATNLTRILKENGLKQGYKYFYAECSSDISTKAI